MPRTILTVEDQAEIRRLIRITLEMKGYRVLEAADGAEGLAAARANLPDLILLDVMMPGMNGLEASRILAADEQLRHIPVVMLSALGTGDDVQAGLKNGARAYIVKPFSPLDLLNMVARLLDAPDATRGDSGGPSGPSP